MLTEWAFSKHANYLARVFQYSIPLRRNNKNFSLVGASVDSGFGEYESFSRLVIMVVTNPFLVLI